MLHLVLAGFLLLPLGLALLLVYVSAPSEAAPAVLLVSGTLWVVTAVRVVMGLAQEVGDEKEIPYADVFNSVDGSDLLARRPLAIFVPFLVTAGWILILAGVVWLAFVNLVGAALVSAALVAFYKLWRPPERWKQSRI